MPSRFMSLLAARLLSYRQENGLSQEEAANLVGCTLPTYRKLEQVPGSVDPTPNPKLSTIMQAVKLLELDRVLLEVLTVDFSGARPHDHHEPPRDEDEGRRYECGPEH